MERGKLDRWKIFVEKLNNRKYYNKKVIILLDEYDTPMQEAYVYGFWKKWLKKINFINTIFRT